MPGIRLNQDVLYEILSFNKSRTLVRRDKKNTHPENLLNLKLVNKEYAEAVDKLPLQIISTSFRKFCDGREICFCNTASNRLTKAVEAAKHTNEIKKQWSFRQVHQYSPLAPEEITALETIKDFKVAASFKSYDTISGGGGRDDDDSAWGSESTALIPLPFPTNIPRNGDLVLGCNYIEESKS